MQNHVQYELYRDKVHLELTDGPKDHRDHVPGKQLPVPN